MPFINLKNCWLHFPGLFILLVFSACNQSSNNKNNRTTIENIDFSTTNSVAEYTSTITTYLKHEGLNDEKEGQIIKIFEHAAKDSLVNDLIEKLVETTINESNLFYELQSQWDKSEDKPNNYKLGPLIRIMYNYPELSVQNAKHIVISLDRRYGDTRFSIKTQSLIANSAEIDNLSEGAYQTLKEILTPCNGPLKDNGYLNSQRKKLGITNCK